MWWCVKTNKNNNNNFKLNSIHPFSNFLNTISIELDNIIEKHNKLYPN